MSDWFEPLVDAARGIDLNDPESATKTLEERLDPAGETAVELNRTLVRLWKEGAIAYKGAPPVTWSRVSPSRDQTSGYSLDAVHMSGAGPAHRHPRGEIDYCVAVSGEPTFDGHPPGWVVLPPDSTHVPTVQGGEMLIIYLLPGGEIEFEKA